MKMGVTVGIVALVLVMTSATIFFMPKNNEIETNRNEEQIKNIDVYNKQEECIPSGDVIVSEEMLNEENYIFRGEVTDKVQESEIVEQSPIKQIPIKQTQTDKIKEQEIITNIKSKESVEQNDVVREVVIQQEIVVPPQEVVEEEIETVINNVVIPNDSVGMLNIPKISLYTPVRDGHSLEVLKTTLGHFDDTAYWQGNIGILGHNSGNAGYFKELTKLVVGDEIQYTTEYGTRTYKVNKIVEIDDTDWSMLANTTDNRITLITCVRGVPEKRLCIQANEIY